MIKNYFLIAIRNVRRQLSYSLINIFGLAIGIACSLVILLYVYGEWSYDRHFQKGERIYRIGISFFNIGKFANGPERLLEVLPKEFAGIERSTRVQKDRDVPVAVGDQVYKEPQVYYTDSSFFQVFDFNFLSGDAKNALRQPKSVVLTGQVAKKYFNTTEAVGRVLEIGKEKVPYTVTGIIEDPDFNTHLTAPIWISNESMLKGEGAWSSAAFYNYVLLRENSSAKDLDDALRSVFEKHVYPESGMPMGFKSLEDYRVNENAIKFYVHPLRDIYLRSKLNFEISPGGNESNIYIFSAIAVFILALAAVNFVNLTTARASRRAKEVGIRKTMGTSRGRLIVQFLIESVLTTTAAMAIALLFSEFFLAMFEYITGSPLMANLWGHASTFLLFTGFSIGVGLLAGIYPAYYLTSFVPSRVLKGNLGASGGSRFRDFLVVFQFSVSILLIVCAALVWQQLHFLQKKDLGFDQDNVLTIDHCELLGSAADPFKDELAARAGVIGVSYHMGEPGSKRILSFYTYQTPVMQHPITVNTYFGDADYLPLLGMKLVKGRNFSRDLASDTSSVILNESAVRALGLGPDPIGAVVNKDQRIIGVVSDFHWESLRNAIAPLALVLSKEKSQLGFKLDRQHIPEFLAAAETRWKQLVHDEPFQYHFVDENFGELLEKESTLGKAIYFFTVLAIFISCLGLYGLSAYTAEQRTKEIGIRKVMGASVSNIVVMLNRRFTALVVLSSLISVPLAYFIARSWLDGFAYRIEINAAVFIASVGIALVLAWLTVGYHSIRAATSDPAETLKYE